MGTLGAAGTAGAAGSVREDLGVRLACTFSGSIILTASSSHGTRSTKSPY
jgi:hypothetical protein